MENNKFEEQYPEFGLYGEDAKNLNHLIKSNPKVMVLFNVYLQLKRESLYKDTVREAIYKIGPQFPSKDYNEACLFLIKELKL